MDIGTVLTAAKTILVLILHLAVVNAKVDLGPA
jgi:hypothetical protein